MALLLAGGFAAYALWPHVQADERLVWAAVLPAVYIAGMWALFDGNS
ncbi:MAG: hypothetical protein KJZ80_02840 [Hyphomicrobiaceae bacterium]|nr:hypothetical protein [Hyphomicrobiaceae bacterium]